MRTARVNAYIDKRIDSIEKRIDDRITRMENMVAEMKVENQVLLATFHKIKRELIYWGIGIAVSLLLGLWSINNSLIANLQGPFGMGAIIKSQIKAEVAAQNSALNEKLDKLVEAVNEMRAARP